MSVRKKLAEKLKEALNAVLPIIAIVMALSFSAAPLSSSILLCFLMGSVLVIVGMMFFTLGSELAMTPMGERLGAAMTKSRKIRLIVLLSFLLGFVVTVSEPDLQVLAGQVPSIPDMSIILSVSLGVGIFLVLAVLRTLFAIPLPKVLIIFYALVFILACFVPQDFWAVAFDSGGVTTGPMTVPFIMAFGVGASSIRNDPNAADDSFGLVSLCSVGPVIAVLILGMIYSPDSAAYEMTLIPEISDSRELFLWFAQGLPDYMHEIAVSVLPIIIIFSIFQLTLLRLKKKTLLRIIAGLFYTYIGLVLFLTGANVGFMPAGTYLGELLAGLRSPWLIIPAAMLMGFFIVRAEPAVYVLNKQVEEITDGAISARLMGVSLSVGVAVSLGIAMIRVLSGISIMWFLLPGYALALGISFFVPKIYTAIAFDSGGVASGPMTAAFLLPMAQGACLAVGGDIVADAFGVVAMVAMTPLITIQFLGLWSGFRKSEPALFAAAGLDPAFAAYGDDMIIEF